MEYSRIPQGASLQPRPFQVYVPEAQLENFATLVSLANLGPQTYENQQDDRRFGIPYKWLSNAVRVWRTEYDW